MRSPRPLGLEVVHSVRPKDAAISCAHFWASALILAGIAGFIMGAILFSEWGGVGSFWVGATAIGTGIAGVYVTGNEPSGGLATGFFGFLSFLTAAVSTASVALGDGIAYLVVAETEGQCFKSVACPSNSCGEDFCVCWKPDGTLECSNGTSIRYCMRYGGDSCDDIEDSESLLLGSSVILLVIVFLSLCSLLVAISTCWFCKRVIVEPTAADECATFR